MGSTGHSSIRVRGLQKEYGPTKALRGIDFSVRPGEIVGFLGPNGAGKSTTMKILTGFLKASKGAAEVAGFDVEKAPLEVRRRVGYLPENVPLYEEMLVVDYLHFIASMREVPKAERKSRVVEVARQTGLAAMLGRSIAELSKGYRQRVGLAQAIIHAPEVLILDEPTTGLDPNQIIEIRDVIKAIGREKTVIFSTHILQEVAAVCDRIIVISEGLITADGTLVELKKNVRARMEFDVHFEAIAEASKIQDHLTTLPGVIEVRGSPKSAAKEHRFIMTVEPPQGREEEEKYFLQHLLALKEIQSSKLKNFSEREVSLEEVFRTFTMKGREKSLLDRPPGKEKMEDAGETEKDHESLVEDRIDDRSGDSSGEDGPGEEGEHIEGKETGEKELKEELKAEKIDG